MAAFDISMMDWLQLSQSVSQAEAGWWQVRIAAFAAVVAVVQAGLFVWQLRLMRVLNKITDLQQRSVFHPEIRITNFQAWPKGGAEGDSVRLVPGAEIVVRVHAVNIGGAIAYLCDEERNCAMQHFHPPEKPLPMFKPWKGASGLSRLIEHDRRKGYSSSREAVKLPPGEFGFWQFDFKVPDGSADMVLYVLGLIAYWDEGASKKGEKARRRLVTFAKFFSEENQVFLSPERGERSPDYNYIE